MRGYRSMPAFLAAAGLLTALAGCSEIVRFESVPSRATVFVDGATVGQTPATFRTRSVVRRTYRIEKEGYLTEEGELVPHVAPGRVVGAVFTLGIVALARPLKYYEKRPLRVNLKESPELLAERMQEEQEIEAARLRQEEEERAREVRGKLEAQAREDIRQAELSEILSRGRANGQLDVQDLEEFVALRPEEGFVDVVMTESLLPFQAEMSRAFLEDDLPRSRGVVRLWQSWLEILRPLGGSKTRSAVDETQPYLESLREQLADPVLGNLTLKLAKSISDERWADAREIRNLMSGMAPGEPGGAALAPEPQPVVDNVRGVTKASHSRRDDTFADPVLGKLTLKLEQAISEERWNDAREIQELIQVVAEDRNPARSPAPQTVAVAPTPIPPSSRRRQQAEAEARSEYEAALYAYKKALASRDGSRTLNSVTQLGSAAAIAGGPGVEAGLGFLASLVADSEVKSSERDLAIAQERLDRAKARLDSFNWR